MTRNSPTLAEAFRAALEARLFDVHTSIPARVESYDAATCSVSVTPLIKRAYKDEEGERVAATLPVISDVPLVFPGAGAYRITFPVAKGDTVLLVFSEASLDKWLDRGGLVDPIIDHRFHLSDAVAIPGLRDFRNASPANEDALVIEAAEIRAGSASASDPVALASELAALKATFDAHVHVLTGVGTTVAPDTPFPSSPGSTKLKTE